MQYTHWLVTKGKDHMSAGLRGLVPIVLAPRVLQFRELRVLVMQEVERRTRLFLGKEPSPIDILKASVRPYVIDLMGNLWISEVRLSGDAANWWSDREVATIWTLAGHSRLPMRWQGAADGVIPQNSYVTIRPKDKEPTPFIIMDD